MSFPQPPNDPQSQQPGYPPPPASGANAINFAALTTPENRAYQIAGGGGLLALIAYFFLPFFSVSGRVATGVFSGSGSLSASFMASNFSGWLYLTLLGSIVALAVAGILALGIRAVPQLTPQLGTRIILGSGAAALLGLVFYFIQARDISGTNSVSAGTSISYGVGFGFWIAALASIGILVGGVMQMRKA